MNVLAYSAEFAAGRAGPLGRPTSPLPVSATLPSGRTLPRLADYGLGGATSSQGPYDVHSGMLPRAMHHTSGAATPPTDAVGRSGPGSSAPGVPGAYMQCASRGPATVQVSPSGRPSVAAPSAGNDNSMEDGEDGTPSSAAAPTASQPHLTALRLHFADHRIFESFARQACRCRHM